MALGSLGRELSEGLEEMASQFERADIVRFEDIGLPTFMV